MEAPESPVTLEFTAASKEVLRTWGVDKKRDIDKVVRLWVERMEAWLQREVDRSFDKQQQPGGDSWRDISDKWKAYKASQGLSTKTNIYTTLMRTSMSSEKDRYSARIGSPQEYSKKAIKNKRSFLPDEDYAEQYAKKLAVDLIRYHVK
jgi:phage gpG-like protein